MSKEKVVSLKDLKKYLVKNYPTWIDIREETYKDFEKMSFEIERIKR